MDSRSNLPARKHPAHQPVCDAGNRAVLVFLTVCAKDRKSIFARDEIHQLLRRAWSSAQHWHVGRYVIMPDHLHLFCAPATFPSEELRSWLRFWKAHTSRAWPRPEEQPIWQQDGWDTQLRKGESYTEKWNYVRQNPLRAGLVTDADDWPYQGKLHSLPWLSD